MFANQVWISNGYKKVRNPTKYPQSTGCYEGIMTTYDFRRQCENFEKIKKTLEIVNVHPIEVYSSQRAGKSTFVVCFSEPNILWQKYEGEGPGTCHNYILYKSHKIKTSIWVDLTPTN